MSAKRCSTTSGRVLSTPASRAKRPDLDAFSDNEENFQWIVSGDSLIVKSLKKIELVVELARVDGALKVVVYRYGVL